MAATVGQYAAAAVAFFWKLASERKRASACGGQGDG